MKNVLIAALVLLASSCTKSEAQELKASEKIEKKFEAKANSNLAVFAINGSIEVEATNGNQVEIEVSQTIKGKNKVIFDKGKTELKLGFEQNGDEIEVYIAAPFDSRPNHQNQSGDVKYDFKHNFKIKVPASMNLHLSTINDGDIEVENVSGNLKLNNINGKITIKNAKGETSVHTINGDVEATYLEVPKSANYYTLNGDIKVNYPASFSADCELKTFQGEFYTDFENTQGLPSKIVKSQEKEGSSTKFKMDKKTKIRFGNGGKVFSFETFNGDILIKKI
jgi:DUF4097 and DUF4098 domain-containing protein YvlB